MNCQYYKSIIPMLIIIILGLQTIFYSQESYAQSLMKSTDFPGGGSGSSGSSEDSGGGSTTLFIVGGVVIAGLLFYEFVINKDEPKKEEKQDSTSNQSILLNNLNTHPAAAHSGVSREMEQFPVDLCLGFQRIEPGINKMKFIVGFSYNF